MPHPFARFWRRVGLWFVSRKPQVNPHLFAATRGPLGFDLHRAFAAHRPLQEAAPLPIFRARGQSAPHGITMHVAQLLHVFLLAPHGKIVVTDLPEAGLVAAAELARRDLLEHLDGDGEFGSLRFADQQVYVLRHDDITADPEAIPAAHAL